MMKANAIANLLEFMAGGNVLVVTESVSMDGLDELRKVLSDKREIETSTRASPKVPA